MAPAKSTVAERLREILSEEQISVDPKVLERNSEDYFWFSNVLEADLSGYCAEVLAWPTSAQQLADVLAVAYDLQVPITMRGGGTGNYGQCVPLRGGLVINTMRMTETLEIGDGFARVQAGVKFVDLDQAVAATGQEVRIFPSTYLTATVSGFICGGSGGIGSVTYGPIVDGNVLAATVYPVTADPQPHSAVETELAAYIHAYGTTGVLADVTVPLAPRLRWEQAVISFDDLIPCHHFCLEILESERISKRLVCTVEPAIVQHFMRARLPFKPDRTAALLVFQEGDLPEILRLAERHRGQLDFSLPVDTKTRLTDFSWNHTTLWAKKSSQELTYLQAGFSIAQYEQQVQAIRDRYGSAFAIHHEYFRVGGQPFAGSLPIIPYVGREQLEEMVDFLESIGVFIANPHRYLLEEGSRVDNIDQLVAAKQRNDPRGLLNPGKLRAAFSPGEQAVRSFRQATMSLTDRRRWD